MSNSDRKPYESATVLNQAFLDACQDNLTNQLELIVDIAAPSPVNIIRVSDRNKYVGGNYYEARLVFPVINRTIGELQSPQLEFSTLTIEINNVDGKYTSIMPAGDDFDGWIGRRITVKLGLRDVSATYKTIFSGVVTDEGGFKRTTKSFILTARNDFDKMNQDFPRTIFTAGNFPNIEDDKVNTLLPVIYGDWTVDVEPDAASVPCFTTNGLNPNVNGDTDFTTAVDCWIADHDLQYLDTTHIYVKRGDAFWKIDSGDIFGVTSGNRGFSIRQSGTIPASTTQIDGSDYEFESGDLFFARLKGIDLGGYSDNPIEQARHILKTYGGVLPGEFHPNWDTIRTKATPAQSAIANIKTRVWTQEPVSALEYALSLLEQIRVEMFLDRDQLLKLSTIHFEDFQPSPGYTVRNWDLQIGSYVPNIDERSNFNRAQGVFNFLPNRQGNIGSTPIFKNDLSIAQIKKTVSKKVEFPNIYKQLDCEYQMIELLRLTSAYIENVDMVLTWRSMLLDIGDFVKLDIDIQGVTFSGIPAQIRSIGYDPAGLKIPVKVWSFQMLGFPGWTPPYNGVVGGYNVLID